MKKGFKTALALILALSLCLVMAACGSSNNDAPAPVESNEPAPAPAESNAPAENDEPAAPGHVGKRVLGCIMSLSDPSWVFLNGIFERQFTEAGFEYTAVSGEMDPLVQIEQIENAVVQGYDEIMIIPVNGEAVADACKKAMDDGVFVYNFINDCVNHNVYRTVDPAFSGESIVECGVEGWALKHFPNAAPGSINAVMLGVDNDAHAKERYDAAVAKMQSYPELNIVEMRAIEPTAIESQAAAENIMTMHPDVEINLWVTLDSTITTGVHAAVMAAYTTPESREDICVVSNALNDESASQLKLSVTNESVNRICAATGGDTEKNVGAIVEQSIAWFDGGEVAPFSPVNVDMVTPENLSDFWAD